jgi:hypothetical protein
MPELKKQLPEYISLISKCIESSNTYEQLLVCMDFINLFCERFRPFLPVNDYIKETSLLYELYKEKFHKIIIPHEVYN